MDVALALLLPLIGGFLFVKDANYVKYVVAREDGHRFYFRVSYYGLFFFGLSALLYFATALWLRPVLPWLAVVHQTLVEAIGPMLKEPSRAPGQVGFLCICLFSVFLGRISPPIVNYAMRNTKTAKQAIQEAAGKDELEGLLVDALTNEKTIQVTMSSGKVYVGWPIGTAEPRSTRKAIAMLPLISGYRDEKQEAQFTTHYDQAFDPKDAEQADGFRLVLHVDKIVSAAFFDIQTYEKFKAKPLATSTSHPQSKWVSGGLLLAEVLGMSVGPAIRAALQRDSAKK